MMKIALAIFAAIVVSGCAAPQKALDKNVAASLKGQTITTTSREKPNFVAMTAGKAAFAMLGMPAMIAEGNGIINNNNIPDPAVAISNGLVKELQAAHGVRLVTPSPKVDKDGAAAVADSAKGAARYVLDAQTLVWNFGYFPTDWTHYRVMYSVQARLIDVQTQDVVAQGICKHVPEHSANAPTYDDLVGNQAAGLKNQLNTITQSCISSLKKEILALQ